jgi:hypothetical protein
MRVFILKSLVLLSLTVCTFAVAQQATGKVLVDILPFTSEIELKKKVKTELESGGLEWGVKDGLMVFTMVNKRFISFDFPQFTRYGTQASLDIPAGEYAITGIGFVPKPSFSVDKALAKGAYFNERVMAFTVEEGKTVTVKVRPVIRKNSIFFVKLFQPELIVSIKPDGGEFGPEISIFAETDATVAWPDYNGPLKFKAAK